MSRSKPLIGVAPLVDEERESYWMLPGYFRCVEAVGGVPVMLPLVSDPDSLRTLGDALDGLLLTGGPDVDPALYHQEKLPCCEELCPQRDKLEQPLLEDFLQQGKPVLGICRGFQLLCVHLGGELWQDLSSQMGSQVCHRQPKPYNEPTHPVTIERDSPLGKLLGVDRLEVNSCHHQGVKCLSPRMKAMARTPDGLVEGLWVPDHPFCMGVQWHPEFFGPENPHSRKLFAAFVDACRQQ